MNNQITGTGMSVCFENITGTSFYANKYQNFFQKSSSHTYYITPWLVCVVAAEACEGGNGGADYGVRLPSGRRAPGHPHQQEQGCS